MNPSPKIAPAVVRDPKTHRQTTVSGRFTADETTLLRAHAAQRGISFAEWVRETLLDAVNPNKNAVVYEVNAIRQLLLGIIVHLGTNGREITIAQLKTLQAEADERAKKRATATLAKQRVVSTSAPTPRISEVRQ